jgi:site-specific recombinase XerD
MGIVSRPKNNTEHKVVFLSKPEMNKLFRAVESNPNKIISMRDKALFSLAIATGMRASALVNINKEDIYWNDGFIKVIEKRQKVREIPIGENTINVLREWIEIRDREFNGIDSTAVFVSQKNSRLSPDAANDALKKYCTEAGIQKKITMHKLRSSAATSLAAAKVDIQTIGNILGHRSTATTLRYVAVLDENKKNAVGILDKLV